jgi:hypothetical protein
MKPATRFMDVAAVGGVVDFECAGVLHDREFRGEYLAAKGGQD